VVLQKKPENFFGFFLLLLFSFCFLSVLFFLSFKLLNDVSDDDDI